MHLELVALELLAIEQRSWPSLQQGVCTQQVFAPLPSLLSHKFAHKVSQLEGC